MRAETWPELVARLGKAEDELEWMLKHLGSRPALPGRMKQERELRQWLRAAIDWIDAITMLGPPEHEDDQEEFILELYQFDLERARAVDRFVELLEEGGESWPP